MNGKADFFVWLEKNVTVGRLLVRHLPVLLKRQLKKKNHKKRNASLVIKGSLELPFWYRN